jgi:hypothetical protein
MMKCKNICEWRGRVDYKKKLPQAFSLWAIQCKLPAYVVELKAQTMVNHGPKARGRLF